MIRDADLREGHELPRYDVLVVGSGPAGTTLACELAGSGLAVGVLESGQLTPTPHGDALRRVVSAGIRIKDHSRERVLGGASATWAGLSSPLDEIDLAPRPELGRAGWPFGRAELDPFYAAAAERYRFPPLAAFGPEGFGALRAGSAVAPDWERLAEKVFLAAAEPQRFGREHRAVYAGERVDLWLDATLVRLEGDPRTRRVTRGVLKTSSGRELTVAAGAFVLAAGGIENARLLLVSRDLCPAGLGNEHDQVGRGLMNHPKSYHGLLRLARPVESLPYWFGCIHAGLAGYAGLRLADDAQRERGLLNAYVRFEPLFPWSDDAGVEALVHLVKGAQGFLAAWRRRQRGEVIELRDYSETGDDTELTGVRLGARSSAALAGRVLLHAPRVAQYLWYRLVPGQRPRIETVRLRNFLEMEPRPECRVTLTSELDANGVPVPRVAHDCSALDRRSLVELHAALVDELERAGVGRLESNLATAEPWPVDQDASHHMGTTRMGTDPRAAVVDPDLRLFGAENVWCAGASVFPTSGCANPTFTLVALSIRLARHLREDVLRR